MVVAVVAVVLWSMTSSPPLVFRNDLQLIMAFASGESGAPPPVFLPRRPLGWDGDEGSAVLPRTPWLDLAALEFALAPSSGLALVPASTVVSDLALPAGLAVVSGPTVVSNLALRPSRLALVSGLPVASGLLLPVVVVVKDVLLRVGRLCPAGRHRYQTRDFFHQHETTTNSCASMCAPPYGFGAAMSYALRSS